MLLHRKLLLVIVLVGVGGSLSATLGYGLYLRSDRYRLRLQDDVSSLLKLNVTFGSVRTLTTSSRAFHDIAVAMPSRDAQVFRCAKAVWHNESQNGRTNRALDLIDGWLLVGTHQWRQSDYETLLKSGLGQDFGAMGLRRIHLDDIDLEWQHPDIVLTVRDAVGEMLFEPDGTGRAAIRANNLNDFDVGQTISIVAYFTPGSGLRFHEASIDLPTLPFSRLGLDRLLHGSVEHGTFRGQLNYLQSSDQTTIDLAGSIDGARLEELTQPIPGGPFHGLVDVTVDQATFRDSQLEALHFRGRISDLSVTELVPLLSKTPLNATVDLRIHQASLRGSLVDYLSAAGNAQNVSLDVISALIGRGVITGNLRANIRSLVVVDDVLQRAEIDLIAVPPEDAPGTIDKNLLEWVAQEVVGVDLSRFLPDHIEYAKLGVRLLIDGDQLRIRGTHGRDGKTLLTIRVLGRELPLIREFDQTYSVGPVVATLRSYLEKYELERLRDWWTTLHAPPPEPP